MASPISFQGVSTGLQTDQLVNAILEQEGAPLARLQAKQQQNQQRISAYQSLQSKLSALASSVSALSTSGFKARTVTSTDSTNTFASATASGAAPGTYAVVVNKTATFASETYNTTATSLDAALAGNGQFTLTGVDGAAVPIDISTGTKTLRGLRDAINASSAGVTASIVQTAASGTPSYKLVLTAKNSGIGDRDTVSITDDGGDLTLDASKEVKAVNADFTINGLQVLRRSNTVTDSVDGLTLQLKKADNTQTTTFTVASDTAAITAAVQDIANKYNDFFKTLKSYTGTNGILASDAGARGLLNQVSTTLRGVPSGLSGSNPFQKLGAFGLRTERDGTFSVDSKALQTALAQNPTAAQTFADALATSFSSFATSVQGTGGGGIGSIVNLINDQNSTLNVQISAQQSRLDRRKTQLQTEFSQMESVVAALKSTQSSLTSLG